MNSSLRLRSVRRSELQEALERLVEAGLIFQRGAPTQATFLFKHALVQDAAYSTLIRGARRDLHARIADALLVASHTENVAPEILALHMQSADRAAEAIEYWRLAGEQSARRANNREAVAHFNRALKLLKSSRKRMSVGAPNSQFCRSLVRP